MRKPILIFAILIACHLQILSQSTRAEKFDSITFNKLIKQLPSSKGQTRVDLLNEIAARINFVYSKSQRKDSILYYASKAYDEANRIGYRAGLAIAMLILSYETIQNVPDSVKALKEKNIRTAIQIGEELRNNEILGYGYYQLTGVPSVAGSFEKKSEYFKLSSEYCLKAGDTLRAAEVTNWLFDLYFYRGEYEEAFEIGKKAVSLSQKTNARDISRSWQQFLVQYSLMNMSSLFSAAGDFECEQNKQLGKIFPEYPNLHGPLTAHISELQRGVFSLLIFRPVAKGIYLRFV